MSDKPIEYEAQGYSAAYVYRLQKENEQQVRTIERLKKERNGYVRGKLREHARAESYREKLTTLEARIVELEKAGQEYIELTDPMVQETEMRRLRIVELEARNAELETEAERNRCIVRSYIHEVDLLKHALQSVRQFVPYPSLMLDRLDRALGPYVPKEIGEKSDG